MNPPQPQERLQENGEDVGDNTDFHVILSSLLKILKMKRHGSYKKVILDEKISLPVILFSAYHSNSLIFLMSCR